MRQIWKSFRALYFASLMMLIGSGLLSTYLALRLAADHVDSLWVGALMAANYFGLVLGGKIGHRLIARVGHIRAYATVPGSSARRCSVMAWSTGCRPGSCCG
jgi:MFS family permease